MQIQLVARSAYHTTTDTHKLPQDASFAHRLYCKANVPCAQALDLL